MPSLKFNFFFHIILLTLCIQPILLAQDKNETKQNGQEYPKLSDTIPKKGTYLSNPIGDYNEAYYQLDRLNDNIGLPPRKFNFQSPQATLEHFINSCKQGNFEDAAYALNLNLFPKEVTKEEAAVLAEKFYFVLNQRVSIDWGNISDRPDGQVDIGTSTNQPIAGEPRRSVVFGEVALDGRDAVLRLQRVRLKNWGAFWMISANTVENIESLYAIYGPRKLDRAMPDWARVAIFGIPLWKLMGTILLIFISYFLGKFFAYITRKLFLKSKRPWLKSIATKMATPAGIVLGVLFFYLTLTYLISFSGTLASTLYAILLVIVIASIAWFLMNFIDYFFAYVAENRVGDSSLEENKRARMIMTYISVARRILTIIIIIVAISVILSQFRSLEKLGISLLASAGLITIILGVAAQNTLGNIIAGIQIALTQPASIGDTVYIENEWGYVEDIRFTYMVVRTWDARRLIVPLKDIISKPFENWSMTNAHQVRPVVVYADYHIDVQKVREKFAQLLVNSEHWDEQHEPVVQVTNVTEKSIEIRGLCSAKDASTTWDLHCYLREELVKFIATLNSGEHLATQRVMIQKESTTKEKEDF
ncbi:mechanosensitive ion channel family protein [Dokdonia sp. Hel_I_53]|uniref:mechanosensitive ion channel family protein n=1 Tax=Dokdonia sp. Hel_I_53 TaxID=1566287 RepID=UPI00119C83E5|nr:mechanosensitive ion channel domain-containing protein [Dokdonia sp. Hel_I_53]TVZ50991.1 small-conductance mechanosensitive channel [Dokdonia sp. Hel_I_53]